MTANQTTSAPGTQAPSAAPLSASALWPIAFVALLGTAMLFVAGHAQSATLHDSAHDMRHSTGFPCH